MKVGVQMKDGSFRAYNVDVDEPFSKVIELVKKEIPDAKRILVLVPPKVKFVFKLPGQVTA
jgi:hypothetical protein